MDTNPFQPGRGSMPPLLAGREEAQKDINEMLQQLSGSSTGASQDIILYGPRGYGKTVLLQWAEKRCTAGLGYTVLRITPSDSRTLKDQVMDEMGTTQAQVTTERSGSLGVNLLKAIVKRSVVQSSRAEPLVSYLIEKANENPLVLLVDEAHTMSKEWGHELLNASQGVCEKAPFLLVLAGTPGLRDCLGTMDASFWIRSKKIPLGRLDASAAADAIQTPLRKERISHDRDVLEQVVAASQQYPFFIQLWGKALWNAAKRVGREHIDQSLLPEAARDVNKEKDMLYQDYYAELIRDDMVPAALLIAKAFKGRDKISNIDLHNIVAGKEVWPSPPEEVKETISKMRHLGYIWQGSEKSDWQPGIPSLMTHVETEEQNLKPDNSGDFAPGM